MAEFLYVVYVAFEEPSCQRLVSLIEENKSAFLVNDIHLVNYHAISQDLLKQAAWIVGLPAMICLKTKEKLFGSQVFKALYAFAKFRYMTKTLALSTQPVLPPPTQIQQLPLATN